MSKKVESELTDIFTSADHGTPVVSIDHRAQDHTEDDRANLETVFFENVTDNAEAERPVNVDWVVLNGVSTHCRKDDDQGDKDAPRTFDDLGEDANTRQAKDQQEQIGKGQIADQEPEKMGRLAQQ